MVQLRVLSGKQAGALWIARRFPVRIGRAAKAQFRADDPGVWDEHALLELSRTEGIIVAARTGASLRVNGESVPKAVLHNGDRIDLGSLTLQFWLSETRQSGLSLREAGTWIGIAAVVAAQVALLYWLLR